MKLPENLALDDVADVLTRLGTPTDRTSAARALRDVVIRGVKEPVTPRGRWRIPRAKLVEVVAACLLRRASRHPDRWSLRPEKFVTAAAELMLDDVELERFVPRRMKTEIRERRRLEAERRRRERGAREAEERRERARREREAKARRLEHERLKRERHEKVVLDWCYSVCFQAAAAAVGAKGTLRKDRPEEAQVLRDWPTPRPDWWLPPPGLREPMADWLGDLINTPKEHPDWTQWIPAYVPGEPWPWRKRDHSDDAGAG
jgi:hypothetical protein